MNEMRNDHRLSNETEHRSRRWTSTALALSATVVTGLLWIIGWVPAIDRVSGDVLLRASSLRARVEAPVAAVLIDDAAVARYGPLPWPRERLARVITAVQEAGARAIAVDLILAEPGPTDDDLALARAVTAGPVTLAAAIDSDGTWLLPLPRFGGSLAAAHAYGEVGPDGVVRTIAATKQADGLSLPALSLAAARLLRPEIAVAAGHRNAAGVPPGPAGPSRVQRRLGPGRRSAGRRHLRPPDFHRHLGDRRGRPIRHSHRARPRPGSRGPGARISRRVDPRWPPAASSRSPLVGDGGVVARVRSSAAPRPPRRVRPPRVFAPHRRGRGGRDPRSPQRSRSGAGRLTHRDHGDLRPAARDRRVARCPPRNRPPPAGDARPHRLPRHPGRSPGPPAPASTRSGPSNDGSSPKTRRARPSSQA